MDERITGIARTQHGVVGRRQLLAAGLPPKHIDALVRDGRVTRISRGTYLVSGAPLTLAAQAMAAAYRCGPGARVVGEPLLAKVGVHTARLDAALQVLVRPGRRVSGVDWPVRPDPWHTRDDASVDGVASVTPARMLLEVSLTIDDARLRHLVDGFRWANRLGAVRRLVDELAAHPGARRVAASGLLAGRSAESATERRAWNALEGLGVETQVEVLPGIRVDGLVRRCRLVVEIDGPLHEDPVRVAADRDRDARLRAAGYVVLRLRPADIRNAETLRRRVLDLMATLGAPV